MSSSTSSPKRGDKNSFKPVSPFEMFYQLTYMSAMAASGIARGKVFEIAAASKSNVATYFEAVNTLVQEFRYDYPEACRRIGTKAKSENMKSFLLRMSDALRSGEPLADFLAREAEVQGEDYQNKYERDLEALKQWTNAFSSIVISVALIIIIQIVSSMIYSTDVTVMGGLVFTGVLLASFGAWIIYRSAPQEIMVVAPAHGSAQQKQALRMAKLLIPLAVMGAMVLGMVKVPIGFVLMGVAAVLLPIGIISISSDKLVIKKDIEYSTFLRSLGGTASSTGATLKQALTRIDLSSFPYLEQDITRLSTRLQAMVEPEICWHKFGMETGSRLITQVTDVFYGAVRIGGDPERVGYLCSLFTAKTAQLRAKRRLIGGTFSGLTSVMQAVVAGLMVFVLSIVQNFAVMVETIMPKQVDGSTMPQMSLGMAEFSPEDLAFLALITTIMILTLAFVSATAIILCNGGLKFKMAFYLALTLFISGIAFIVVPPMVQGILTL